MYTLSTQNLETMKQLIPIGGLSKTNRDAILITRRFGIKYLWIDSLCIAQDSEEDWIKESKNMCNVYSNSICNIAASSAQDGRHGCIIDRDLTSIKPLRIVCSPSEKEVPVAMPTKEQDYVGRGRSEDTLGIPKLELPPAGNYLTPIITAKNVDPRGDAERQQIDHRPGQLLQKLPAGEYYLTDHHLWIREIEDCPLMKRAWVLQERFLAPRTLHFGARQLIFECPYFQACETFPLGFPGDKLSTRQWRSMCSYEGPIGESALGKGNVVSEWQIAWIALVSAYSKGKLSRGEDKLAAFHGISSKLERHLGSRYIAGLWEKNISEQLLWRVQYGDLEPRPGIYQAPSWSWASINGRVEAIIAWAAYGRDPRFLTSIGKVRILNPDAIHQIKAELPITGRLLSSTLIAPRHSFEPFATYGLQVCNKYHFRNCVHLDTTSTIDRELFLVPMFAYKCHGCPSDHLDGLLLEAIEDSPGQFQRIGMFSSKLTGSAGDLLAALDLEPPISAKYYIEHAQDSSQPYNFIVT